MCLKVEASAPAAEIKQDVSERTKKKTRAAAEMLVSGGREGWREKGV